VNGGEMFGILAKSLPKLKLPRPFAAFAIDAAVEDLGVGRTPGIQRRDSISPVGAAQSKKLSAISYQLSAISQSPCLVLATWHGCPSREWQSESGGLPLLQGCPRFRAPLDRQKLGTGSGAPVPVFLLAAAGDGHWFRRLRGTARAPSGTASLVSRSAP
jgi:hypothetical protein